MSFDLGPGRNSANPASFGRVGAVPGVSFDAGLRKYMLGIYNYMTLGLLITAVTAWFAGHSAGFAEMMVGINAKGQMGLSGLGWIVTLAPLAFVLVMSFGAMAMKASTLRVVFLAYSAAVGLSLFSIFMVYTEASIARTFFITAATFGAMSLWGYTTRRDLTGMGNFLMMGLIGVVLASVVNIFMRSPAMDFVVSLLSVVIFTGLTAWDTQKAKQLYSENAGAEATSKLSIMMALSLYLDFLNLFLQLLRFFGQRRE